MKSWEQIIEAIKRTAADNDGVPAGLARGERDIGILITAPLGR